MDITQWKATGNGFASDLSTWKDEQRLRLYFEITHNEALATLLADHTRCFSCLNVDENGELRDGDKGFAACWKGYEGSWYDTVTSKYQYEPKWQFLQTVKVTNKGNNLKSVNNDAWDGSFKWNAAKDLCNGYTEEIYYTSSYHRQYATYDKIQIFTKKGFKYSDIGFKNG